MTIPLRNALGRACNWLGECLIELSRHLIACPECGRSRYYGAPCVRPWTHGDDE